MENVGFTGAEKDGLSSCLLCEIFGTVWIKGKTHSKREMDLRKDTDLTYVLAEFGLVLGQMGSFCSCSFHV